MLFEDLKAFVAVIECTSLTKAASRLNLTQSAVSRRIQHLEQVLDAELFDRSTRPPQPSAIGRRIYQRAVGLLHDADLLLAIPQEDAAPSGTFRVGFPQVIADIAAFDLVSRMKAAFPRLDLQVITDWSFLLEKRLARGEFDAAALMRPAPSRAPTGFEGQQLGAFEVWVVQSRAQPLADPSSSLAALAEHEWVLNPEGCGYRDALVAAIEAKGKKLKLGIDTHGTAIQMRMVASGLGLGLIPRQFMDDSPLASELSVISVSDFSLTMDIWGVISGQPGNLRLAHDLLAQTVREGLAGR
ncbi:LysR family transcriptional regulator [Pseudomonas sp. Pseu.R1]|uniref:LysR family transcriptional regulator n=1 Tax=Pseudomonas sp. Pseu.R1 TaxID=3379818 RepID=UPI003B95B8C1